MTKYSRAYFRLERLFRDGSLFCFLEPELQTYGPVPRDGNRLEGGINHDDNGEPPTQPTLGNGIDWDEFHTQVRYPNGID